MGEAVPDTVGRYEIRRVIGGGGMGVLCLARDPAIDRLVAIKLLREGLDSAELRARFAREARSAGNLHHPNVVTIYDVGEHNGQPFIAMEYIRGKTLSELIGARKPTPMGRKLEWIEDLCAGLHYAHRSGVIHRDIKPANVMVSDDGVVKLLDFGIARVGATGMTQGTIGTLNYMAPEQMEGRPVDARADIFSLGALCYELLSYRRAFPGGVGDGIVTRILSKAPDPLEGLVAGIDPQLVAIVNRCLEKEPDNRYTDCATLARDIASVRLRLQQAEAQHTQPLASPPIVESTPAADSARRARQRSDLLRMRADEIRSHLALAETAMARGAFEDAVRECERALMLDPDHAEASRLLDAARAAFDERQIDQWVAEGHDLLGRGAMTDASVLVDRALSLNPAAPGALSLRQAIHDARQQILAAQKQRRIEDTLPGAAQRDVPREQIADGERTPVQGRDERQGRIVEPRPRVRWRLAVAVGLATGALVLPVAWRVLRSRPVDPPSRLQGVPPEAPASANQPVRVDGPKPPASLPQERTSPDAAPANQTETADGAAKSNAVNEARALVERKHYARGVTAYAALVRRFGGDASLRSALEAARLLDAQQRGKAKDLVARGDGALQARQYDEAVRLYESAIDQYPDGAEASARLKAAKAAKARADAAVTDVLGGKRMPDEERARLLQQADALAASRLFDAAIAVYDQILAVEPDNTAAKDGRNRALASKPKQ